MDLTQQLSKVTWNSLLLFVVCILLTLSGISSETGNDAVLRATKRLSGEISRLFSNSTRADAFEQLIANQRIYESTALDLTNMTADFAYQMAALLHRRSDALWRSKKALEETAWNYSSWTAGSDDSVSNISVASTTFSHVPVNLSVSSVKLPIDVDRTHPSVVSSIVWSRSVEHTLIRNLFPDPSTSWQYFGSRDGFMRIYPAVKWLQGAVDTFDARFERWYIEGSLLPSDVVILIDRSGSMHGLPLVVANQTAIGLIDLLTERDRLAIITFAHDTTVLGCMDASLKRTTRETKAIFIQSLSSVKCHSVSRFEPAFQRATELLIPANTTEITRQKIIVLLSDGAPVRDLDFFRAWNVKKNIRVLANVVGPPGHDVGSSWYLACENAGFHQKLRSVGAVREGLRSFVKLMGRSGGFQNTTTVITPPVKSEIDGQYVVRLSLPVVNGTAGINNATFPAPTVLGVVGVDIPLSEMEGLIPRHLIGPSGYAIVIDKYGRSLIHPKLKETLNDSLATDILQLEGNWFADIRAAMLRGERGSGTRTHTVVSERDGRLYVRELEMTYSYANVWPNSSVSACLVIPRHQNETIKVRETTLLPANHNGSAIVVTPWLQCFSSSRDLNVSDVNSIREHFDTASTACKEWRDRLLVDLNTTAHLANTWENQSHICNIFISTLGSVTRKTAYKDNCNRSEHDATDNPVTEARVARAVLSGNNDLIIESATGYKTQITQTVYYGTSPLAVIGLDIRRDVLQSIFNQTVQNLLHDTNRAYLIDQSGYIIEYLGANFSRGDDDKRGKFIGDYEVSLMNATVERGVFTATTVSSYRPHCDFQQTSSGAASFFRPWILFQKYVLVGFYNLIVFLLQADLVSLFSGAAFGAELVSASSNQPLNSCLLQQTVYSSTNASQYTQASYCCWTGTEDRLECSAIYSIAAVPNTNLLLVVVDGDDSFSYCSAQLASRSRWVELPSPCTSDLPYVKEPTRSINVTAQLGRYLCTSRGDRKAFQTVAVVVCILLALGVH